MSDETKGSDAAVEQANNLGSMSDEELLGMLEESRIVIRPGGEVVIENMTLDLLEVAFELDPDNPGVSCRIDGSDAVQDGESSQDSGTETSGSQTVEPRADSPDTTNEEPS